MKWRWELTVATAVLTISTAMASPGSAAPLASKTLKGEALGLAQMPARWTAQPPSYEVRMGCLTGLLEPKGVKQTQFVEAHFEGKGGLPQLIETLSTYSNSTLAYQKIAAKVASCKKVTGTLKGYPVSGTLRAVTSPKYGNARALYLIAMSGQHLSWQSYYALVRKGNVVVTVLEGNLPKVDAAQFRGFVTKALARVH